MADFSPGQKRLVIFAKVPQLGRVKTRLAQDIGAVGAAAWYRRNCAKVMRPLAANARWQTVLAVSPDRAASDGVHFPELWPINAARIPQGPGDLGARMAHVFRWFPPGPIVLIGSDIPGITPAHIAHAFKALGEADAVFGPAYDGGYWLVGFRRLAPVYGVFNNIRWSTEHALQDTLNNLKGRRVHMLKPLGDVDRAADL